MYRKNLREPLILLLIVLSATLIRAIYIWIGRPEFVGWFNHTYYYYVQTRGILTTGELPFPDMPLLFYLYAYTAKILGWLGVPQNTAIIQASRGWMCIVPSLIPIPIYYLVKSITTLRTLNWRLWTLVTTSAILPLSISHLTEFAQKNALGLLWLACLLFYLYQVIDKYRLKKVLILALLSLLIMLTHFGTLAALTIVSLGFAISIIIIAGKNVPLRRLIMGSILLLITGITLTYIIDEDRFARIFYYTFSSIPESLFGLLFFPESSAADRLLALTGIALPAAIGFLLLSNFRKTQSQLGQSDQIFWLGSIISPYLLFLPIYDQLLLARFALFAPLILLVVIVYVIRFSSLKNWVKNSLVMGIGMLVLLMAVGEFLSLGMQRERHEAIYADLMEMQTRIDFSAENLVLTKNGAEHICNWFFNTKAGVITAFNEKDFQVYDQIYILNPIEGQLNLSGIYGKQADNEKDRYHFMMRNIPAPDNAKAIYKSEYMEVWAIEDVPTEWTFDADGNWLSYDKEL